MYIYYTSDVHVVSYRRNRPHVQFYVMQFDLVHALIVINVQNLIINNYICT